MTLSIEKLNDVQISFVNSSLRTNSRLLAPAGCGKTMTLLFRANRIVEELKKDGIQNPRILVLTFTNPARLELIRKAEEFGFDTKHIVILTLNKWGSDIIKENLHQNPQYFEATDVKWVNIWWKQTIAPLLGKHKELISYLEQPYKGALKIYDETKRSIFNLFENLKALGFPFEDFSSPELFWRQEENYEKQKAILHQTFYHGFLNPMFDLFDDLLQYDEEQHVWQYDSSDKRVSSLLELFRDSFLQKRNNSKQNLFSFEDQKFIPLQMLRNSELEFQPYHYIFVDEFQDINALDFNLVKAIGTYSNRKNGMGYISVVGDADQAIFEWRNAVPDYIINCERYIPNLITFQLDKNYRSPANIVELSQNLIQNNKVTYARKRVIPILKNNAKITIMKGATTYGLSKSLIPHLRDLLSKGNSIAFIGRKRAQLVLHQMLFIKEGLPYFADEDLNILFSESFNKLVDMLMFHALFDASIEIEVALFIDYFTQFATMFPGVNFTAIDYNLTSLLSNCGRTKMSIKDFISLYVSDTYLEKQFRATTTALKGFLEIKSVYSAIEFLSKKKRFRKDIFPENSEDIFKKIHPLLYWVSLPQTMETILEVLS